MPCGNFPRKDYWIELKFTHSDHGTSYVVWGVDPFASQYWKPGPNTIRILKVRGAISTTDAVARALLGHPVVETVWSASTARRVPVG